MKKVYLRKLNLDDVSMIESEFQSRDGASEYQWFGYWNSEPLKERIVQDHFIGPQDGSLAVVLEGQTIGRVEWFSGNMWGRSNTSSCWEIAVGIFKNQRGKGYGKEAQRLLVEYLFHHYPKDRIQATTAIGNLAEQSCLTKIGFMLEGRVRHAQWRGGQWHDQLLYSILREEWIIHQ